MKLCILYDHLLACKWQTLAGVWQVRCFTPAGEFATILMWVYNQELFLNQFCLNAFKKTPVYDTLACLD